MLSSPPPPPPPPPRASWACAAIGLCAWIAAAAAHAQSQDCGQGLSQTGAAIHVQPPDRATAVARDAPVVVRFAAGTDLDALQASLPDTPSDPCAGLVICLLREGAGGAGRDPVPGRVERIDDHTLAFLPDAELAARARYFPLIARPGFDRASRTELQFETGGDRDRAPPRFDPSQSSIAVEVDAPPEECRAPEGSVRVRLSVPRAGDDGDPQSVEILLFLTRAAGLSGPVLRARADNPGDDGGDIQLSLLLTRAQSEQPVCVALQATDGVGKAAPQIPLCFDPARGALFAPCSVGAAPGADRRSRGPRSLVGWALAGVLAAWRGRRRSASRTA